MTSGSIHSLDAALPDQLRPECTGTTVRETLRRNSLGSAKRLLRSQWGLRNAASAVAIREHVWFFMEANDRLLVSSLDVEWTSQSTIIPINEI